MAIAVIIVLSLLGSAVAGLLWFLSRPAATILPTLAATTAVPERTQPQSTAVTEVAPTSETTPIPPTPTGPIVNRIAFVNPDRQVMTVAPDGSNERLLTDTRQAFQFPAWSPDGTQLAVIGGTTLGAGVYLLRDIAEPPDPEEIFFSRSQVPIYLYWSPDSRVVSFIANHPEGLGLYLVSIGNNGASERLLTTGSPFYWNWTADSSQILIHTGFAGAASRLALIDAAGDGDGENLAAPGFFQAPSISWNGRYLAYAEEMPGSISWLVVTDTETGEQYTERHAGLVAMGWSPTADQLAFISGTTQESRAFFGPLRLLDAQTGEVRLLSRETVLAFFWSPDGRSIAYINPPNSGDGGIQALEPWQRQRLGKIAGQRQNNFRLVVVDVATGEGQQIATFEPTLTFLSQFLPFFDQYALSHRIWSPASDALVLPMRVEGENRLFVIPTGGGAMQPIGVGDMAFWSQQ